MQRPWSSEKNISLLIDPREKRGIIIMDSWNALVLTPTNVHVITILIFIDKLHRYDD